MSYESFLAGKQIAAQPCGLQVDVTQLNDRLFDYQKASVHHLLQLGKGALFASTGLGKSICQLSWADVIAHETGGAVLLLAPLAVSKQTAKDARSKYGVDVRLVESQGDISKGINITNYEKLHKFESNKLDAIVLDESSTIKASGGKISDAIIQFAKNIPYRLACSATPAPNDYMEFGTHCEFLSVMSRAEMLCTFFKHDSGDTAKWRLKRHAEDEFWKWVASWAMVYRMPSDIGFSDEGFVLPPLVDHHHVVDSELEAAEGMLIPVVASLNDRRKAKRSSIEERVNKAVELAMSNDEPWMFWVELNEEGDRLEKQLSQLTPYVRQVAGRHTPEQKEKYMMEFADGDIRILISKSSICGTGLNWQHCRNVCFVGISDSWEQLFQSTNRFWRFGQTQQVNRHLIFSEHEWVVFENFKRKAEQAEQMWVKASKYFRKDFSAPTVRQSIEYCPQQEMVLPDWLIAEAV